jgi:flagellar capping protein FliD
LKESAQALYGSKSLFMKNADGKYDMEAIYEKVNAFIEDYNETVKAVGSAETDSIARAGASMVNAATEYADMFDKLGISISGADFTLSINKEKFLESNIADVKSMFSGVGSFAYQMGAKASRINNLVADKVSASGSYHSAAGSNATSTSKDNANTIAKILDSAKKLNAVGVDLYKNRTLFNDINGEYDVDAILEEVGAFVESYNDLIIKSENSKAEGLANAVTALKNITDDYASKLEKIGISVDKEDKTLSINEDTFRASKMYNVEALFNGTASYTYKIAVKSAMVANQAETEANKANTYKEDATYANNYNTGSIFNDII